ncbi:MAG: helix-turn-helix domain-containing protein [Eubacteriales bacterium]
MSFGQVIKKLRRGADMTQEQLAEMLAISPQAVSRWETDAAMPDISLIPALTGIFGVTSDELLEIDVARNNEKIMAMLDSARNETGTGEFEKAVEILREAHRQYPRSAEVMERLAHALVNYYSRNGIKNYDDVIDLCNRVLDVSTDSIIRYKTTETLGEAYDYAGKENEVRNLSEKMTPFRYSREKFMLWRMEGDDGLRQRREYLASLLYELVTDMYLIAAHRYDDGRSVYSDEDRILIWKQAVGIVDLLYPDGDYQSMGQEVEIISVNIANAYLRSGDTDSAIDWLEKACDYVICFDTYDFNAEHTSPAFRGIADGGWIMENGCNRSAYMLDSFLSDDNFNDIRDDTRFKEIISRLEAVAKKKE